MLRTTVRLPRSPFLYPILDTEFSVDLLTDAHKLIRAGCRMLQIRAKNRSKGDIYQYVTELTGLCQENQVCFIINDHVDVALVTQASGVHLGQEDFPVDQARRLLGNTIIGLSTHDPQQFSVANESPVDYIAIGPVYKTATKRNSNPFMGISKIIPLLSQKSKPIVAIGGIRAENIGELVSAGIDGIALISGLYSGPDVYETASRLIDEIRKHEEV